MITKGIYLLVLLGCFLTPYVSYAQKGNKSKIERIKISNESNYVIEDAIYIDSIYKIKQSALRTTLDSVKQKSKFRRFFISSIMLPAKGSNEQTGMLRKNTIYDKFQGEEIDTIFFDISKPFNDSKSKKITAWLTRTGNNLHVTTQESVIIKNLLFKSGDTISSSIMSLNEYMLRALPYISNAYFLIEPTSNNKVNVIVYVRDNLSLGVGFNYYGTSNDSYITLYESNFLGRGDILYIKDRFNIKNKKYFYSGDLGYTFTNVWKTFFDINFEAGYGKDYHTLIAKANKSFIRPSDYAGGLKYENLQRNRPLGVIDTVMNIKNETIALWGGKSFKINNNDLSLYFTIKGEQIRWFKAPPSNRYFNPLFHNTRSVIGAFGISKEHFYRGNLIYGYGYTEDIPYGYKAELIGGYTWSDDYKTPYIGVSGAWGFRNKFGYYNVNLTMGAYTNGIATLERAIVKLDFFAFTNLLKLGQRYSIRCFARANYTNGHNMLSGEIQRTWFQGTNKIKGLTIDDEMTTKLYASPEIVLFTPWNFIGFKFAPYIYADLGTLGNYANPFKNKFYASMGLGIRIKNETLIIPTVQFRLAFMLRGDQNTRYNPIELNGEQRLKVQRFNPTEPYFIAY